MLFFGMDKSIPYNEIQNIIVGQGLAPAAFSRDFFGRSKPLPYNNLRITYKRATKPLGEEKSSILPHERVKSYVGTSSERKW